MKGNTFLRIAAALVVWLVGGAETALGQGNTWPGDGLARMVEGARWRLGELRVNAAFTLANAGYDSDIYYGYFGGNPVPDWTFSAGAPVQILLPISKKIVLDLSDTPQYLYYFQTQRERAFNNTFRGQIHFAFDRLYVQAGGETADVRRRFSLELDINVREKRDALDGLILWQASRATSVALSYKRAHYDYGDAELQGTSIAEMLNRNEDHVDMIAYIQPSSKARLYVDGQYGIFSFTGGPSGLRDAKSYGIYGGIEFIPQLGELAGSMGMQGGFKVGYIRLDVADPGLRDGAGFAGEANLSADLTNRTSLQLFFSRGFQFSVYSGASYYLSTIYRAGLSQRLSRRAALSYDVSFGRSSYPRDGGALSPRDRYTTHSFSLNFALARHLSVTLLGTLGRRVREAAALPSDRRFFGLSLTYGFPGSGMGPLVGELIR